MLAALYGHKPIVDFLLAKGANAHAQSKSDFTAADFAAMAGHDDITAILDGLSISRNGHKTAIAGKDDIFGIIHQGIKYNLIF